MSLRKPFLRILLTALLLLLDIAETGAQELPKVFDIDAAKDLCSSMPLDEIEGIWAYPDDNVTVLVRRMPAPALSTLLPSYQLMAVETTDTRIRPGTVIGFMDASAEKGKYTLRLYSEIKNGEGAKPKTCMGSISKEGDTMILSHEKSKLKLRINFNPNTLLPALWKSLIRFGVSTSNTESRDKPKPGMVRIYPSYDGNGSIRRQPRYL